MGAFETIYRVVCAVAMFYALWIIAKRERTFRQPVKYMVSYLRMDGNRSSYGSVGVDVKGGIKSENIDKVVTGVREKTGLPDAFIMGFSRYED